MLVADTKGLVVTLVTEQTSGVPNIHISKSGEPCQEEGFWFMSVHNRSYLSLFHAVICI